MLVVQPIWITPYVIRIFCFSSKNCKAPLLGDPCFLLKLKYQACLLLSKPKPYPGKDKDCSQIETNPFTYVETNPWLVQRTIQGPPTRDTQTSSQDGIECMRAQTYKLALFSSIKGPGCNWNISLSFWTPLLWLLCSTTEMTSRSGGAPSLVSHVIYLFPIWLSFSFGLRMERASQN